MLVWLFHRELEFLGDILLMPFEDYPKLELVAVVIVIPIIMNAIIFWITDSFIKSGKQKAPTDPDLEMQENDLAEKLTLE